MNIVKTTAKNLCENRIADALWYMSIAAHYNDHTPDHYALGRIWYEVLVNSHHVVFHPTTKLPTIYGIPVVCDYTNEYHMELV